MQIAFYEGADPAYVLPRLIEKIYTQKQRGVIWVPDTGLYQALHDVLWTFSKISFIPHGGKADGLPPEDQPFWFTHTLENPNNASVLLTVCAPLTQATDIKSLGFSRVVDVCTVAAPTNHEQYAIYQQAGLSPQWWINTTEGWKIRPDLPAVA